MGYQYYATLTPDDLESFVAYSRSVPHRVAPLGFGADLTGLRGVASFKPFRGLYLGHSPGIQNDVHETLTTIARFPFRRRPLPRPRRRSTQSELRLSYAPHHRAALNLYAAKVVQNSDESMTEFFGTTGRAGRRRRQSVAAVSGFGRDHKKMSGLVVTKRFGLGAPTSSRSPTNTEFEATLVLEDPRTDLSLKDGHGADSRAICEIQCIAGRRWAIRSASVRKR